MGGWNCHQPGMGNVIDSHDDRLHRKWAIGMIRYLLRYNFDGIQFNFDYPGSQTRPVNRHLNLKRFLEVRVCVANAFMCVCSISVSLCVHACVCV